jgi:hypothetical protein
MPTDKVLSFDIEGQCVRCYQTGDHRSWRCECAYFERTLNTYGNGFCPHVVVAIARGMRDGSIDFSEQYRALGTRANKGGVPREQ